MFAMTNRTDQSQRNAVLNDHTDIVHKRKSGKSSLQSECGSTRTVTVEHLRRTSIEQATDRPSVSKCGRCFRGVGGY